MTINEIQKVLVKFPRKKDEIFACFPFLIALSESLPKAEINIVVEEGCMPAFSFLPFKVRVFQRPKLKTNLPGRQSPTCFAHSLKSLNNRPFVC